MSSLGSPKKRLRSQTAEENKEEVVCCGICYAERGVSITGEIDCCSHHFCFVYHPHGNMATGPADSYTETKCGVCHAGTDEHLLLLCDLCDTASHTYCVGLGYTVSDGDWFCHDSEPSVTINIFDIVRETGSRVVNRPRASPLQQNLSSPVIPLPDRLSYLSRLKGKGPVTGVCNMQRNVKVFRENWNALRSGSFQFRCNSFQPGSTVSQKQDSSSLSHHKLDGLHSMASTSLQQSTVQGGPSNKMLNERVFKDADKAWKMMDRAKRIQRLIIEQAAFYRENTKMEKQCDYSSLNQNLENRSTLNLEEKKQSRVTCVDTFKVVARQATHTILATCSSDQQKSSTSSSSSVCSHADNTPQFQKSTLMPNCCRQCFYDFVNNVVNSTILEKVGCA
uniref:Zinc finger PHD-type domain-containing protein n=2 Tax=Glycine max TaxID=3847 RepID=A0A0R0JPU7_SOYBN